MAMILLLLTIFIATGCKNSPQPVKILDEDQVKNEVEFQIKDILLSDEQFKGFQKYASTGNEQLLKGLAPMEIFQYYYYAFKTQNTKTLYELYIKGDAYGTPSWREFEEKLKEKDVTHLVMLEKLQEKIENFSQIKYDDKTSYIQVNFKEDSKGTKEPSWNFKLLKNSQGVWKVDWIPFE